MQIENSAASLSVAATVAVQRQLLWACSGALPSTSTTRLETARRSADCRFCSTDPDGEVILFANCAQLRTLAPDLECMVPIYSTTDVTLRVPLSVEHWPSRVPSNRYTDRRFLNRCAPGLTGDPVRGMCTASNVSIRLGMHRFYPTDTLRLHLFAQEADPAPR